MGQKGGTLPLTCARPTRSGCRVVQGDHPLHSPGQRATSGARPWAAGQPYLQGAPRCKLITHQAGHAFPSSRRHEAGQTDVH